LSSADDHALQHLLALTEDELYQEVGSHLYGQPAFGTPARQLIELGKRWSSKQLADLVCGNQQLQTLARQDIPTQELVLAIAAVIDIVAHMLDGVPATTAAVLVVRIGLHKLCATIWADGERVKGDT